MSYQGHAGMIVARTWRHSGEDLASARFKNSEETSKNILLLSHAVVVCLSPRRCLFSHLALCCSRFGFAVLFRGLFLASCVFQNHKYMLNVAGLGAICNAGLGPNRISTTKPNVNCAILAALGRYIFPWKTKNTYCDTDHTASI